MSRRANFDLLVGATGAGKSTFLLQNVVKPLQEKGNRILVVKNDINKDWGDVPFFDFYDEIKTFEGIRKLNYLDGRFEIIQKNYSNGALILEDCRGYIDLQSDKIMQWLLIFRRHVGIDLFAVFHGLTEVPPKFFTHADRLILFSTNDNINKRSKEIYSDKLKLIDEARLRIEDKVRKGNKYAYEIVNLDIRL